MPSACSDKRRRFVLRGPTPVAILACAALSCSPTGPGTAAAPPLQSIRYVRTYPVQFAPSTHGVFLNYAIPILGDPYHRSRISSVSLRAVDASTFAYDYPGNFSDIPNDVECTFSVLDAEVSPNEVARDIYVNGTRIRVESATTSSGVVEHGLFKVSKDGRVY